MNVSQTIPLLRIFDVGKAREFYLGYLGFAVDWETGGTPAYMQVSRDRCVLHLTEHHGDCCPGAAVYIRVDGLEAFHREISAREYPYMLPGIERAPWNADVMEVIDPFGNRLRFAEETGKRPEPH